MSAGLYHRITAARPFREASVSSKRTAIIVGALAAAGALALKLLAKARPADENRS
jgi:hypothetical protein